ncbi:MAG TPA: hypothetical protein VNO43_02500 [Candidatus Eisenbacteria bacterium]|nr:hypothetical protein [Candidatus Eisenbacteria bacterium]
MDFRSDSTAGFLGIGSRGRSFRGAASDRAGVAAGAVCFSVTVDFSSLGGAKSITVTRNKSLSVKRGCALKDEDAAAITMT